MKGIINKFSIVIIILLSSACSIQHQYANCVTGTNTQQITPKNQVFGYTAPVEGKTNFNRPTINVPMNAYPTKNQMFYQNSDSGTSSTGPR